ncbi:MAG: class I SAM-dependent methyltransferase [Chloroflexi bacterium]|nr:class I SAM-dependent methyltransferase [Chloroflexota bacterium]
MTTITACRSCGSRDLFPFLDLHEQPLANALLTDETLGKPETLYPLKVVLCKQCTLIQITEDVDPEIMFGNYLYFSSFSDTMLRHAKEVADRLRVERKLNAKSLVVELASNDGYLLKNFVAAGVPVLGVEPARNIAKYAIEHGIPTVAEFFGVKVASRLEAEGKHGDVMLANNVMAHVPDINDVVGGIKILLKPDGIFVMETPYAKDMIDNLEFDTMYHEHYYCHSLTALEHLYRRHGLAAADVEWIPIHGGTLQVTVTHAGKEGDRPRVRKMLEDERAWVGDTKYYADFGKRVDALRDNLVPLLTKLRAEGKRVVGYGAAAKGSTLMNYMGIDKRHLEYVVDRSTYKQNKYMPGSHLPILPPERIAADKPDFLLLLAWNLADEIMAQQAAFRAGGGKFIVPVPAVRVV